jgi:IS30 family transposase
MYVCHESIYQYIYSEADWLVGYLARRHKKRHAKGHSRKHRRSHIPNRVSISERSDDINERKEFGHWEADSIVSRASKSALNILVERKARYTKLTKLTRKTSKETRKTISRRLSSTHKKAKLSITYDNGSENVEHELINAKLGTKSYFCAPYRSWEKGTVENSCGLVRRFLPKKTDIAKIAESDIRKIERMLNNRPRKCLGYETPAEVFARLCGALAD